MKNIKEKAEIINYFFLLLIYFLSTEKAIYRIKIEMPIEELIDAI